MTVTMVPGTEKSVAFIAYITEHREDAEKSNVIDRKVTGQLTDIEAERPDDQHPRTVPEQNFVATIVVATQQPYEENQVIEIGRHKRAGRDGDNNDYIDHGR